MLKYRHQRIRPVDKLTLHIEKLIFRSRIKDFILSLLINKRVIMKSSRGPEMVTERLIVNLKDLECQIKDEVQWLLNVNSKHAWESIEINTENLILGPNIEFESSYVKEKLEHSENAVILVPSKWVIPVLTRRLDWFKGKYVVWQIDLDLNFWKPSKYSKRRQVLIYRKDDCVNSDFLKIIDCCEKLGMKYKEVTYGKYSHSSFRRHLNKSMFAVWLGTTESQGIALLECWSTNVPTLVREKNEYFDAISGEKFASSSAPYLTRECGEFFTTKEFDCETLANFASHSKTLEPRKYILEQYSISKTRGDLVGLLESFNS